MGETSQEKLRFLFPWAVFPQGVVLALGALASRRVRAIATAAPMWPGQQPK